MSNGKRGSNLRPLTPSGIANQHILKLTLTLCRLGVIDDISKMTLYFDLRDYWLSRIATAERIEWERLRGK
jgi:hypothetical protein